MLFRKVVPCKVKVVESLCRRWTSGMDCSGTEQLSRIRSGNAPQPFPESMTGSTDPSIATDYFTYIPGASVDLQDEHADCAGGGLRSEVEAPGGPSIK